MGVFRFRVDQRNEQRPRLSVRPKWQNKFEDELATNEEREGRADADGGRAEFVVNQS